MTATGFLRKVREEYFMKNKIERTSDIAVIDEEHVWLGINLINFFTLIESGDLSTSSILGKFDGLIANVERHFTYEEKVMRNIGLPSYEQHQSQHLRLLLDMEAYRKTLSNKNGIRKDIHGYLIKLLFRTIEIENQLIYDHLHREDSVEVSDEEKENVKRRIRHDSQQPTVLIVDDEATNIHVLAGMLKLDYHILFALSGEDALRIAELREPDLILLDVRMPGMDGFTVCTKLKANPLLQDIPVIFVTAMNEVNDEVQGLEVGAIDYIIKPAHATIVRNRVRNHLELKTQRDTLRSFAVIDGLTGLTNRRGFEKAFDREWRRSRRNRSLISLIVADIDHFKAYNDRYGHITGDECLRIVADIFRRQMIHPGDLAARYGGEELVCLLPDTDATDAEQTAQRILADFATQAIRHEASPTASVITVSAGIATAVADSITDRNELLAFADCRLYEAKNSGRNRICAGILPND